MLNLYLRTGNPDTEPNFATTTALVTYLKTLLNYPGLTQDVTINVQGGVGNSFGSDTVQNSLTVTIPTAVCLANGFTIKIVTDPTDLPTTGPALFRGSMTWGGNAGSPQHAYKFVVSGVSPIPAVGDTYTHNGFTYSVRYATASVIFASTGATVATPLASGTLTRATGAGQVSISFSSTVNDIIDTDLGTLWFDGVMVTVNSTIGIGMTGNNNHTGKKTFKITNNYFYVITSLATPYLLYTAQFFGNGGGVISENNTFFVIMTSATATQLIIQQQGNTPVAPTSHIFANNTILLWKTNAGAGTLTFPTPTGGSAVLDSNTFYDYSGSALTYVAGVSATGTVIGTPALTEQIIQAASDTINTMLGRNARPLASSANLQNGNATYATAVDIYGTARPIDATPKRGAVEYAYNAGSSSSSYSSSSSSSSSFSSSLSSSSFSSSSSSSSSAGGGGSYTLPQTLARIQAGSATKVTSIPNRAVLLSIAGSSIVLSTQTQVVAPNNGGSGSPTLVTVDNTSLDLGNLFSAQQLLDNKAFHSAITEGLLIVTDGTTPISKEAKQ